MKNLSRRTFLEKVGVAVGASALAATIPSFTNTNVYEGRKLNIALCGLGRYAGYLAEGLQESKYCKLAGIVTGTPAKAEKWQKQYNILEKIIYNYQNFDEIVNNKEVEESITWQLVFPSGAVCTSTSAYNCGIDRFFATADDGFFELKPAVSYGPFKGRTSKSELNFPDINQQATQCDEIGKVLLDNKQLPSHITGEEGLKDMKVLEAIYKAANTGKKVSII